MRINVTAFMMADQRHSAQGRVHCSPTFLSCPTGPTLARMAGEGGKGHQPGEGQPPKTP